MRGTRVTYLGTAGRGSQPEGRAAAFVMAAYMRFIIIFRFIIRRFIIFLCIMRFFIIMRSLLLIRTWVAPAGAA